jgi:uncharacterized protein YegL
MNEKLTELVFVLDRSGSMSGHEADTIGGFNSLLARQQAEQGQALVSTVLFDHEITWLHDRADIRHVRPITADEYWVRGSTALLDAVGESIERINLAQHYAREEDMPAHTMFAVATDGLENASQRFSLSQVKAMVRAHKKAGWEFIFLGANIDAMEEGASMGFGVDNSVDFMPDPTGTAAAFDGVCLAASQVRRMGCVQGDWRDGIDDDYVNRSGVGRDRRSRTGRGVSGGKH